MTSKLAEILVLEQYYKTPFYNMDDENFDKKNNCYFRLNGDGQVTDLTITGVGLNSFRHLKPFKQLRTLNLSNNKIRSFTSALTAFENLEYLDLSSNLLQDIIPIKRLKSIRYLNIRNNSITDLTPLYQLIKNKILESVNSEDNPLIYPPAEQYHSSVLEIISWFDMNWSAARQRINNCLEKEDVYLDLGNSAITDLDYFPELFDCRHLRTLILSNEWAEYKNGEWNRIESDNKGLGLPNNIYNVPATIKRLVNLEVLICGGDWRVKKEKRWNRWRITNLNAFTNLRKLKFLNLSNNIITVVGDLGKLQLLEKLHLNNNLIARVRNEVVLFELREIYLSNNLLHDVSFLNSFPAVRTIDLHANSIRELLPIRELIEKLTISNTKWKFGTINVALNRDIQPRLEVISQGQQSVLAYFEQAAAEMKIKLLPFKNNDIKLILVGNSNVGKSSLVHWLIHKKFSKDLPTTNWLKTVTYEKNYNKIDFKIQVFDFGGQEYYHDTHHLFFTSDTVYLLLWDKQSDNYDEIEVKQLQEDKSRVNVSIQNYPLHYWLDSIQFYTAGRDISEDEAQINKLIEQKRHVQSQSFAYHVSDNKQTGETEQMPSTEQQPNVLVVQNKVDGIRETEFLDERTLRNKYNQIYDFFRFSIQSERGLGHLEYLIFELIQTIPIVGREFLGTWGIIKKEIEANRDVYKKEISISDFKKLCNNYIKKIPEVLAAGKNEQEAVLFDDIDADSFAKYLTTVGLVLYYPQDKYLKDKVFVNQKYVLDKIYKILAGLDKYGGLFDAEYAAKAISLPVESDECQTILKLMEYFKIIIPQPGPERAYIAPLYLPKKPLESIGLFLSAFKKPIYRYKFEGFIQKNIILEFFHKYSGMVLQEPESEGLYYYWREGIILKDGDTGEILLVRFINGDPSAKNQAFIDVYCLNQDANSMFLNQVANQLERLTTGRAVKEVTLNGKDFVPVHIIHENEKKELWLFRYNDINYRLTDFRTYLNSKTKVKNIFISYSKDDLTIVNEFIKHLAALRLDGKISNWYCTELIAGNKWNAEIQSHFDQSDIICFMVSPNFMKTQYIMDHEVKWAFERQARDASFKIVPIILDFCKWTTNQNNLGDFTALPYTAKPVVDFRNRNMAWYITEACIRIMIEQDLNAKGDDFYVGKLPKDVLNIYERITRGEVDA